jgi:hypothetical protein
MSAFPRLLMATVVGLCLSTPLEIRVLEPEIDVALELQQRHALRSLNNASEKRVEARRFEFVERLETARRRVEAVGREVERRRAEIDGQRTAAAISVGRPTAHAMAENLAAMEREFEDFQRRERPRRAELNDEVASHRGALDALDGELEATKASNVRLAAGMDGLVRRIHLAHEVNPLVAWALTALLILAEVVPVLVKMMLVRGPYDYLVDAQSRLALARAGVARGGRVLIDEEGNPHPSDVYLRVEPLLASAISRAETARDRGAPAAPS